jgi:MYXO-CTERM domain-containing protein
VSEQGDATPAGPSRRSFLGWCLGALALLFGIRRREPDWRSLRLVKQWGPVYMTEDAFEVLMSFPMQFGVWVRPPGAVERYERLRLQLRSSKPFHRKRSRRMAGK